MKIEFDTASLEDNDAKGIVALLVTLYGSTILPTETPRRVTGMAPELGMGYTPLITNTTVEIDEKAADGYPTPAPVTTGDVERDKDGLPWDERIHSSSKNKTQAGIWARRRNIEDTLYDSVRSELMAANTARTLEAAQGLVPTPTPPAPVAAPVAEPSAAEAFSAVPAVAPVPTPPAPAVAPVTAPPAPTAAEPEPNFVEIMQKITPLQGAGKINQDWIAQNLTAVGVKSLGELAAPTAGATRLAFMTILKSVP